MDKTAFDLGVEHALNKIAFDPVTQGVGFLIGKSKGAEQKRRGEHHSFGVGQGAASLLLPGGAGYQLGRYMSHKDGDIKRGKKKTR